MLGRRARPARPISGYLPLSALPEGTELTLTHARFHDEAVRDDHREGWSGALDKLESLLAQPA